MSGRGCLGRCAVGCWVLRDVHSLGGSLTPPETSLDQRRISRRQARSNGGTSDKRLGINGASTRLGLALASATSSPLEFATAVGSLRRCTLTMSPSLPRPTQGPLFTAASWMCGPHLRFSLVCRQGHHFASSARFVQGSSGGYAVHTACGRRVRESVFA